MAEKKSPLEGRRATELLEFLDEERRKDKALLLDLARRLEEQAAFLSDLASRGVGWEDQIVRLQGQLKRLPPPDDTLLKVKDEVVRMLESYREERRRREAEALALRQKEMEDIAKALQVIKEETGNEVERLFSSQKKELDRLSGFLVQLRLEIEAWPEKEREQERRIDYVEGWAKQSAKKIGELELATQKRSREEEKFRERVRVREEERRKETDALRQEVVAFREALAKWHEERALWKKEKGELAKILDSLRKLESNLRVQQKSLEDLTKTERKRWRKEFEEWKKELGKDLSKSGADLDKQVEAVRSDKKEWVELWQAQAEHMRRQMAQMEEWLKNLEEKLRLIR